jgi:hypothetical protein
LIYCLVLYVFVFRALFRLQSEEEHLAYGDLSRHMEIIRYDEIDLVARMLERIRLLLICRYVEAARQYQNEHVPDQNEGLECCFYTSSLPSSCSPFS